jgi:hypothetical protein
MERLSYGLGIADNRTSAQKKEGNPASTQCIYKRINTFCTTFLADIDKLDVFLASKDMYIPHKVDFINCNIIFTFISWFTNRTSPATSHVSKALMFLQCKLSDDINRLGESPRRGLIREGPWIKKFTKNVLVKVASS